MEYVNEIIFVYMYVYKDGYILPVENPYNFTYDKLHTNLRYIRDYITYINIYKLHTCKVYTYNIIKMIYIWLYLAQHFNIL